MADVTEPAPVGTLYVCHACGKTARSRIKFNDAACVLNSVLCHIDSLVYGDDGRVIKALAAEEP